jgi:hypothetical protein
MTSSINWLELIKRERRLEDDRRYGDAAEPWQLAIDEALLVNDRVYVELPRGHDKTGRLACHALCWLLDGSGKMGYAAGVDKDNARLFRNEMQQQAGRNPDGIFKGIEFYNYVVENRRNGNMLQILSSDAPSNVGLKFSLLLINDFVDWQNREFFEILMSATGKIPGVKVWIESNAGKVRKGYKWEMREHARTNSRWYFKTTKKWLASWVSKDFFDEMRHILLAPAYRRLIENEWIEESDAFMSSDQVRGATNPLLVASINRPEEAELVATSSDLGISKDATAVATVARIRGTDAPLRLLDLITVPGSAVAPVQIATVEQIIADQIRRFGSDAVVVDPWNMRKTIQDKQGDWPIIEFAFSPANLMHLTSDVFRRVVNKQIEIFPDAGKAIQGTEAWDLQRELTTAIIRQMPYGERIDHRKSGYTDRIIAIGMALWWLGQNDLPKTTREFQVHIV